MNHEIRMTAKKILARLELVSGLVYRQRSPLEPLMFEALADEFELPNLEAEATGIPIPPQSYWGGQDINFVMRGAFAVPKHFDSDAPIALFLPLGETGEFSHAEALVYVGGKPFGTTDRHHQEIMLTRELTSGAVHKLLLHGWTGTLGAMGGDTGRQIFMGNYALVQIDQATREFVALARMALQTANLLEEINPVRNLLYNALDAAFLLLETREPFVQFYQSVPFALESLRTAVANCGVPLGLEVIAAGHAHIDVAWLWTLGQTRQKLRRTFWNVLRLMEQFPDYKFTQSQPQLYQYALEDDPVLLEAIKEKVRQGRWEIIGGMWVEADCNISGGESLARQLILGRKFFAKHFGVGTESPVLWLPDVFGYAWNLPQLIKQAGLEYFFTIKIGWNQVNQLPFDSFWWQGLDGTKVLTHFSTTPDMPWSGEPTTPDMKNYATYNAQLNAFGALGSWAKLKHKAVQKTMLMSYGYGDGGGGPTREMLENAQVLQSFPAVPKVRQGKVIDFFRKLESESGNKLPTWNAELYLEIHRGTYTSQARNKLANRKSEFLLHDAEFLATYASLLEPSFNYPHAILEQAWRLICLNQFHDIIPGSSIGAVYKESLEQYEEIRRLGSGVLESAFEIIKTQVGGDVVLVNPTGFPHGGLAFWDRKLPKGKSFGQHYHTQELVHGTLIACEYALYPYSARALVFTDDAPTEPYGSLQIQTNLLENDLLRVELNDSGDIVRIFDKEVQREVLPHGAIANQFQAFEDRPLMWDAWDIDIFYDDKMFLAQPATSIRILETGALRVMLEIERQILGSRYTQRISLTRWSKVLQFETLIDWRERHTLLKVAFPVEILSPKATFEIQWGSVERPTHRNTSWDWARFETCAQKWVMLSESGYGVGLINDSKYGHDIQGNTMRLSLLRSPTSPDPQADQGEQRFTYALVPSTYPSEWEMSAAAYELNDPILVRSNSSQTTQSLESLVTSTNSNIILETIKKADDGNGMIVRLFECNRSRGWVDLETAFELKTAHICNLLEENQSELEVDGQGLKLYVTPFQIVTLRLIPVFSSL
jgi:alpha-mannosidase